MTSKKFSLVDVFSKVSSGRFMLTMAGAISFSLIVNTLCKMLLEKAKDIQLNDLMSIFSTILIILSNIFTFYFVKSNLQANQTNGDTNGNGGNGDDINGRDNRPSNQANTDKK